MKVEKIDHISIAVKNLKKAQETYEKVLGLKLHCVYLLTKSHGSYWVLDTPLSTTLTNFAGFLAR